MILLNTIKGELRALGIEPKKSLGHNFLVNESAYKKVVAALEIKKNDTIIEVGPGLGTLTSYLAESGAKIIAVEKDRLLIAHLKNKFKDDKNVIIIEDDILKFDPRNYKPQTTNPDARSGPRLERRGYKLVGNIPYYLTSHLIRAALEKWPRPEMIVLMVQKEVAQRITARPPDMSLLAVSVQYYAEPKIISYVSAGSFYPPPEVDSAIIKLTTNDRQQTTSKEAKKFFKVAKAGFAGKRKQLINNLAAGLKISKSEIHQKLSLVDINPQRRAETLTIEEWQKITNSLFSRD